jgi:hypothetical protein
MPTPTIVLGNGCDNARAVDRKALESRENHRGDRACWHRTLSDRLTELEAKQDSLTAR